MSRPCHQEFRHVLPGFLLARARHGGETRDMARIPMTPATRISTEPWPERSGQTARGRHGTQVLRAIRHAPGCLAGLILALCCVGCAAPSITVGAAGLTARPNPSSDGSYAVRWTPITGASAYRLIEDGTIKLRRPRAFTRLRRQGRGRLHLRSDLLRPGAGRYDLRSAAGFPRPHSYRVVRMSVPGEDAGARRPLGSDHAALEHDGPTEGAGGEFAEGAPLAGAADEHGEPELRRIAVHRIAAYERSPRRVQNPVYGRPQGGDPPRWPDAAAHSHVSAGCVQLRVVGWRRHAARYSQGTGGGCRWRPFRRGAMPGPGVARRG